MSTVPGYKTTVAGNPTVTRDISLGRSFVHPLFDYLLIGGGLSIPVTLFVMWNPGVTPQDQTTRVMAFLLFNYAHFAASTVRLYSKPGSRSTFRFLCYGFPIVALCVLTTAVIWPQVIGKHLWALMLTWSPYHYAAQAYGLAVMYCYRSGCILKPAEKQAIFWISMLPFLRAFASAPDAGLAWFVPSAMMTSPSFQAVLVTLVPVLTVLTLIVPIGLYARLRGRLPLISLMLLASNGIWWIGLSYTEAWFWATIFHAIQYLAIVVIFHVNDKTADTANTKSPTYHALTFYAACYVLGMALFLGLPQAYDWVGLANAETAMMVAATINIHHFIVDGYIWRRKRPRKNS